MKAIQLLMAIIILLSNTMSQANGINMMMIRFRSWEKIYRVWRGRLKMHISYSIRRIMDRVLILVDHNLQFTIVNWERIMVCLNTKLPLIDNLHKN